MVNLISENGTQKYGIMNYVVDTPNDLSNLPTTVSIGSTCFIISTSENYMLNSDHQWIKVNIGGGSSGEADQQNYENKITIMAYKSAASVLTGDPYSTLYLSVPKTWTWEKIVNSPYNITIWTDDEETSTTSLLKIDENGYVLCYYINDEYSDYRPIEIWDPEGPTSLNNVHKDDLIIQESDNEYYYNASD